MKSSFATTYLSVALAHSTEIMDTDASEVITLTNLKTEAEGERKRSERLNQMQQLGAWTHYETLQANVRGTALGNQVARPFVLQYRC